MTSRLITDRAIDPSTLSEAQKQALLTELYAVQRRIFAGVDRESFGQYCIYSSAPRTRVEVYRSETGEAVGFSAVHVFEETVLGKKTFVMRAEVGLLPEWRGQSAAGNLLAKETVRLLVRSPMTPRTFVACPVHPASYYALARTGVGVWPQPNVPTPPKVQALLTALDDELGLHRAEDGGAHARKVGWITRQTASEAAWWSKHESALVQFYLRENPGFTKGDGLRIAIPLDARAAVRGIGDFLRRQARRAVKRWTAAIQPLSPARG